MQAKRKMISSTLRLMRSCRVSRMVMKVESFCEEIKSKMKCIWRQIGV